MYWSGLSPAQKFVHLANFNCCNYILMSAIMSTGKSSVGKASLPDLIRKIKVGNLVKMCYIDFYLYCRTNYVMVLLVIEASHTADLLFQNTNSPTGAPCIPPLSSDNPSSAKVVHR